MRDKAESILNNWLAGVNSVDLESVLALYNDEAVLIPTFSDTTRCGLESIREYFEAFSKTPGLDVSVTVNSLNVQQLTGSIYSLWGEYLWEFNENGVVREVLARFTFTMDISSNRPIMHHHSSAFPGL